eukprot:Platyproteum_vivax@DN2269_c0_g1_i1.p1
MLTKIDHPLSHEGFAQAQKLSSKIEEVLKGERTPSSTTAILEKEFIDSELVFCSPLARAVQTGIVALHNLPQVKNEGIQLLSDAREIKNAGSLDSVASTRGDETQSRVLAATKKSYAEKKRSISELESILIDPNDTTDRWWNGPYEVETPSMVKKRMFEFVTQLKYNPANSIIVVGHSLFFKAFFKTFSKPNGCTNKQERSLLDNLAHNKVENCGVIGMEINFAAVEPRIQKVSFLFESTFITHPPTPLQCVCTRPPVRRTTLNLDDSTTSLKDF